MAKSNTTTGSFGDGLPPNRLMTTKQLAEAWGRKDVRRLEESLERAGIRMLRLGNGLTLTRTQDIWDRF